LYVDRPLPMLLVHRRRRGCPEPGTESLVTASACYLVGNTDSRGRLDGEVAALLEDLVAFLAERFGAVLVLEVRSRVAAPAVERARQARGRVQPTEAAKIVLWSSDEAVLDLLAGVVEKELPKMGALDPPPRLERVTSDPDADVVPLLEANQPPGCVLAYVALDPVHYDPETGKVFPLLLRQLRRELARVLRRAAYAFALERTEWNPPGPAALARRALLNDDLAIDHEVAAIGRSFEFLLNATPVNAHEAWQSFSDSGFQHEPKFRYRPIDVDPGLLRRKLYAIGFDRVEDPDIAELLREQREELAQKLRMLEHRCEKSFLYGSLQLYGGVDDELLRLAQGLPAAITPESAAYTCAYVSAEQFAERAESELAFYRKQHPGLRASVEVRDDVAGLIVAEGKLLVDRKNQFPEDRVEALVQHEVGTHIVTFENGLRQPLRVLSAGLAGAEELQEATAVLAEHLVGGLTAARLRLLGGRVIAVRALVDGATFVEVFRKLTRTHGFPAYTAFVITMRVFRSGGLTKDAIYLRGLVALLHYIERGGKLEPLYAGKLGLHHVRLVRELIARGVLLPPAVMPRYLRRTRAVRRLERLRNGVGLLDLVERHAV
jgi:uncharacterized protein (TIGR02421 family)